MKVLAMTRTYYMLLVITQLRMTIFKDDEFDLIFTDTSKGSENIYSRIADSGVFDKTFFLKMNNLASLNKGKFGKVLEMIKNLSNSKLALENEGIDTHDFYYERFLCYVPGMVEEQIVFNEIRKFNHNAKINLYEEGFTSYNAVMGAWQYEKKLSRMKLLPGFMKLFGKEDQMTISNIEKAWVFEPELIRYEADFEIDAIPKFNLNYLEVVKKLNYIFDYERVKCEYDADAIFIEDSFHFAHPDYGDLELIERIYNIYPDKNRFMVKLHPRTQIDRFASLGIRASKSSIPFELLVMNSKEDRNLYITIASGAPLGALVNFDMRNRVLVLYKCCKGMTDPMLDEKTMQYMNYLKKKYPDQLMMPENISELDTILKSMI